MNKYVEIYNRSKSIALVAAETGEPWHVVYLALKKAGVIEAAQARPIGEEPSKRMGAWFQREFCRLVPQARARNDKESSKVDFTVGAAKVEVKASSLYKYGSEAPHWKFCVISRTTGLRDADYYVCFGRLNQTSFDNYVVFLFPAEVLTGRNVRVCADGHNYWFQFRIDADELQAFFDTLEEV